MKRPIAWRLITLAVGLLLIMVGFVWGHQAGEVDALEDITAQCVGYQSFEFRTHVYICDLDDASKKRVFSPDTHI